MKKLKLKRSKYMTFAYSKKGKCNIYYLKALDLTNVKGGE